MSSTRARLAPSFCIVATVATVALVLAGCSDQAAEQPPAQATTAQATPSAPAQPAANPGTASASAPVATDTQRPPSVTEADLPPLPVTPYPAARPIEVVNAVFTFAAKHPEVLSKVPCFCGCERMGHRGNDDCFVKARDARGRPTEWEAHGLG